MLEHAMFECMCGREFSQYELNQALAFLGQKLGSCCITCIASMPYHDKQSEYNAMQVRMTHLASAVGVCSEAGC